MFWHRFTVFPPGISLCVSFTFVDRVSSWHACLFIVLYLLLCLFITLTRSLKVVLFFGNNFTLYNAHLSVILTCFDFVLLLGPTAF